MKHAQVNTLDLLNWQTTVGLKGNQEIVNKISIYLSDLSIYLSIYLSLSLYIYMYRYVYIYTHANYAYKLFQQILGTTIGTKFALSLLM